ncbi:sterol desaturase family protein [Hyunsoonleella sp. SJ7]|uniref:Sterol desaturase family protein n=1 Tax=Hyunsoonleella aquatilis TaxID=2762758 RepID=A0A923KG38_9FLAO|nr:sterol desaturase family protein [Hyunsoonleella aquatilis]MBC3757461.1 sterol desaturase family protein [Hyunsoonleella aquatilis]
MENLLNYFETIPSLHRGLLIVGGLIFFWFLEGIVPLYGKPYKKWRHAVPNIFFTITTILINIPLAFLFVASSEWVMANNFGILNWLPETPMWLYVIVGLFLMDLIGAYLPHLIEHKVKPLWMIHLVHHTDHNVDATTANRHHPFESAIRFVFTLAGIFIVGTPIALILLYQALSVSVSQFSHSNIKLPKRIDTMLSYVVVSPDMHKVHHHYRLPYTDSNYGNIFSVWDRLFGTFMTMNTDDIVYGIDVFPDEKKNGNIGELLKQPFQKYEKPTMGAEK